MVWRQQRDIRCANKTRPRADHGQPITVWSIGADAQAGPTVAAAQDVSHTATGGMVSGGSAAVALQVTAAGSGGAVTSGSAATLCQAVHTATGGAAVSGAVGAFAEIVVIAAGATVLSGEAVQSMVCVHSATGGVVCGGWAACEAATATGQPQRADTGRLLVGVELSEEYAALAVERIRQAAA